MDNRTCSSPVDNTVATTRLAIGGRSKCATASSRWRGIASAYIPQRDRPGSLPALVRRITKATLVRSLYLIGHVYRAGGVPILCYHSIDDSDSAVSVSPAMFEGHMAYLKRQGYQTISLSRLCQVLTDRQPLPRKTVVLTFDDGFRNNHSVAMPILKQYGFTATIFVVTGCVGKQIGWARIRGVPDLQMASWDQIEEMSQAGLEIQAHTVTHPHLCKLALQEIREEIRASKAEIESRLGKAVTLFAYPYGEFDPRIEEILSEFGFVGAVTAILGRTHVGDPVCRLKRINVTDISRVGDATKMLFFKCCITGTSLCYSRMKRWLPMFVHHYPPSEDARES